MRNDYLNLTGYLESNGWVSFPSELAAHVWTRPERMMNIPVNISSEHPKEWAALIGQIADANGVPVESVLDQIMQPDVDRMYPSAPAGTDRADIASSIEMNLGKPLDSIDGLALTAIDWAAASTVPPSTRLTGVARHTVEVNPIEKVGPLRLHANPTGWATGLLGEGTLIGRSLGASPEYITLSGPGAYPLPPAKMHTIWSTGRTVPAGTFLVLDAAEHLQITTNGIR